MSSLTRDGTAEPVSRDQILRRERGQGNIHFHCSADHVQDWQLYPVDPYSCYMCDHTSCELIGAPNFSITTTTVVTIDNTTQFDFMAGEGKERLNPSREKN